MPQGASLPAGEIMKQTESIAEKREIPVNALRGIVDSLTSGILAVDLEMNVLFVNAALARRLGLPKEKCEGQLAQTLFDSLISGVPLTQTPEYRLHDTRSSLRPQSSSRRGAAPRRITARASAGR